ncbi:MAG: helix-turn-helix domain-containing protein [Candidatus Omnitrophica bacterium]|nr:helix-turn-helix domain-containing protein [Candidatus Omnitrophota bacterium]MBU4472595.1 helix-turn-helix domain-containing protein [Candidatus Omnitrophota bacterium]MCG2706259.1 helix-turn-helix domain-containing protein [Candidatus Omnitrophota bacterium]
MEKELEEWHQLHKFHLYSGSYETKELANLLKVSPRTIQRWLKEKSKPTKEQLVQIKRYLVENQPKDSL